MRSNISFDLVIHSDLSLPYQYVVNSKTIDCILCRWSFRDMSIVYSCPSVSILMILIELWRLRATSRWVVLTGVPVCVLE